MGSGEGMSTARALELIQAGLAGLAADEIDEHQAPSLGDEAEQILRAVGRLQVEAARRLARFDALGGPAADDAPTLAAWLGRRCRLRPWEAGQLAATARRMHLLSDTLSAFAHDDIGFGDVATIAEGVDRAADTMAPEWSPERIAETAQPILLEVATRLTPAQLRKAACRVALTLDGENSQRRRRQIERRSFLNIGQTMDGVGVLRAEMGAGDLAILEKTVDVFGPLPDQDRPRWANVAAHRRLRGLITACQIALNAAGRHGFRERGGTPVRVHLIAGTATVDPAVPATQAPPGRTEFGTIITGPEFREMVLRDDTLISTIHVDPEGRVADRYTGDGQPLDWGRTRRFFTAAQREVYLALYTGCVADGCDRPLAWADIDHIQAWADGGRTDLDNGQPLCPWHNRRKEENRRNDGGRGGREPPRPETPPPADDG